MPEFLVEACIGNVAAGGNVKVMDRQPRRRLGLRLKVTVMWRASWRPHLHHAGLGERVAGEDGDAVIALLAHMDDEGIAEGLQLLQGQLVVRALGLLQAQDVGAALLQEAAHLIDAQANELMFQVEIVNCTGEALGRSFRLR